MADGVNPGERGRPLPSDARDRPVPLDARGRPLASKVTRASEEHAAERPLPASLALSSRRPANPFVSPHSGKFRLATGFLFGIALAAVLVAVAIAARGGSRGASRPWSDWSPSDGGRQAATEIADHIAPYYRLTAARQLDLVTLISLSNPNTTGTGSGAGSGVTVAVNTGQNNSLSLLGGSTIAYNLCGTGGSNCQLAGAPSSDRLLLLRREALELALYTFKYVAGTDNVICVLPPGHTEITSTLTKKPPSASSRPSSGRPVTIAVVFLRQELQPFLDQPLAATLQQFPPLVSQLPLWVKTAEAGLVDQITARGLFSEQIETQQTGGNLLVLSQLPPQ